VLLIAIFAVTGSSSAAATLGSSPSVTAASVQGVDSPPDTIVGPGTGIDVASAGTRGTVAQMNACINKIDPKRTVPWKYVDKGAWGATWVGNPKDAVVYIAPRTPANKMCDVVFHEWIHVLQARAWGAQSFSVINDALGIKGPKFAGVDQVADCGALMLGAKWINYGCTSSTAKAIARTLLNWDAAHKAKL